MWFPVLVLYSFLRLNSLPLHGCITLCSSIHPSTGTWVAHHVLWLWLFQTRAPWAQNQVSSCPSEPSAQAQPGMALAEAPWGFIKLS